MFVVWERLKNSHGNFFTRFVAVLCNGNVIGSTKWILKMHFYLYIVLISTGLFLYFKIITIIVLYLKNFINLIRVLHTFISIQVNLIRLEFYFKLISLYNWFFFF